MYTLHGDRLDAHCIDVELVLRVSPSDELRVDGTVYDRLVCEDASPQYCTSFVTLFFLGEIQRVVTA